MVAASRGVDRAIAWLCQTIVLLTGIALLVVLTSNIGARYVLATGGFDWAQEVPERLFPWFIMAGVVLAGQQGGHVAVEWILPRLAIRSRQVLLALVHLLIAGSYIWLTLLALDVADITGIELSPVLGLPTSHGYFALAGGAALLSVSTLCIVVRIVALGPAAVPTPMDAPVA